MFVRYVPNSLYRLLDQGFIKHYQCFITSAIITRLCYQSACSCHCNVSFCDQIHTFFSLVITTVCRPWRVVSWGDWWSGTDCACWDCVLWICKQNRTSPHTFFTYDINGMTIKFGLVALNLTAGWSSGLRPRLRNQRSRVQIPVVGRGFNDEQLHLLTSHGCLYI
jgi:hypothetical protein